MKLFLLTWEFCYHYLVGRSHSCGGDTIWFMCILCHINLCFSYIVALHMMIQIKLLCNRGSDANNVTIRPLYYVLICFCFIATAGCQRVWGHGGTRRHRRPKLHLGNNGNFLSLWRQKCCMYFV